MGVVDNMKEVSDLVKKFNDIELNRRILALENEVLDLSREKRRAEEKIEELERALRLRKELYFSEPFYWSKGDMTNSWAGSKRRHSILKVSARSNVRRLLTSWDLYLARFCMILNKRRANTNETSVTFRHNFSSDNCVEQLSVRNSSQWLSESKRDCPLPCEITRI
jgi:hypothetical protein